jgi:hypothetical protein
MGTGEPTMDTFRALDNSDLFAGNNWRLPIDAELVTPVINAFSARVIAEPNWKSNPEEVAQIELGFTEALTNAISHSQQSGADGGERYIYIFCNKT